MSHIILTAILVTSFLRPAKMFPQTTAPPQPQPQRGQRASQPRPQPPMTLRQVIESLISLKNSTRVEDLISRRGVQFQGNPAVLGILREFGAGPKLLGMIPVPPPPPSPPAPKVAGALTVVCEPRDCSVIVKEMYKGPTADGRKTVAGLPAGETTVEVFAEGYERITRTIQLQEGQPQEEKFVLKKTMLSRQQSANAALLKALSNV